MGGSSENTQSFAGSVVDNLRRDVSYGWRTLRRSPGFTIAIVLSLAIVIGANAALFGLVDAMFLRRLPLPNADRLAMVRPVSDGRPISITYAQYQLLRASAAVPPIEAYRFEGATAVTQSGEHTDLWIDHVTGGYFQLLGVAPLMGRVLDAQDERAAAPVAVVSEAFWTRYLGRNPDVLGRPLRLNDMTFTLVGVIPARFTGIHFARRFQIAVPFTISPTGFPDPRQLSATMIARLDDRRGRGQQVASIDAGFRSCCVDAARPVTARDEGRSFLRVVPVANPPFGDMTARYEKAGPGVRVVVTDASHGVTWGVDFRDRYRNALAATMAGVMLLLLIACANVATLLLARGEAREREFAVRRSLGAGASRIKAQLFVEGLELAFAGALVGFLLAALGTKLLLHALPRSAAPLGDVIAWRSSGTVIAFTAGIMIVCAVVTSLWPARRAGREELVSSLAGARRPVVGGWGADRVLVVAQVALAIVLITAASLFVSTVRNMTRTEGGFGTRNVLLASVNTRQLLEDKPAMHMAYADLLRDVAALSGAEGAAITFNAPVLQDGLMQTRVSLPGSTEAGPITVRMNLTSTGFFSATGIGLVSGRDFSLGDDAIAPPAVIVSQGFERRYYGARSALGATVMVPSASGPRPALIVGVARDAHYDRMTGMGTDLRNIETQILYLPLAQMSSPPPLLTLVVRTAGDPLDLAPAVRQLAARRAGVRVDRVVSLGQVLDDAASRERFAAALAIGFGVIAVILAGVGVFGVLWFHVSRRTKEIGIRMALGAQRADALRLILRQSFVMTAIAVSIGLPLAVAAAWMLRAQLYGVGAADPRALLGSAALLSAIAIVAGVIPSHRASRVDPLIALREDG